MASQIDSSKPIYGTPTTQSVRDNFQIARTEITQLQDVRTPNWPYLPIAGGIMTGKITLDADPVANLQAATKQYVDNIAFSASGTIPEAAKDGWFYSRGGATTPQSNNAWSNAPLFNSVRVGRAALVADFAMSITVSSNLYGLSADSTDAFSYNRTSRMLSLLFGGNSVVDINSTSIAFKQPVTVAANPTVPLGVATKQYVDTAVTAGAATIVVSDTAPVAPTANALWWDSIGTQLYLWYNDGTSTQWVNATNAGIGALNSDAPTDGQTYGRRSGTWNAVPVLTGNIGRNLIHNSMFNVTQRGAGNWTVTGYTLDRWRLDLALDTTTVTQTAAGDSQRAQSGDEAMANLLAANVTGNAGATAFTLVSQPIEDVRRLAGKTVTISLWAYATSGTPKIGIGLRQFFGTGGSPSALVDINATPITLSTTSTRYSVTIVLPSIAGKTFGTNGDSYTRLGLFLSAGANTNVIAGGIGVQTATFVLWGVQLEIGSVATQLEKIEYADDLRHCQRFFERRVLAPSEGLGIGTTQSDFNPPTAYFVAVPFKVTKRSSATITTSGNSSFAVAGIAVTSISAGGSINGAWMHFTTGSGNTNAAWTAVYVTGSVGGGGFIDATADL